MNGNVNFRILALGTRFERPGPNGSRICFEVVGYQYVTAFTCHRLVEMVRPVAVMERSGL